MPTYEYRCQDCNYQFEKFQSITDCPLDVCPKCGGHIKRVISGGSGLIFKGSGFYITDYKKSSTSPASQSDTSSSKKNGSSPSAESSKSASVPTASKPADKA
ncbi:MAG: zinc ribbon domain-containing protein [Candidatus Delongbacteria bacterium]|nr:zinc ribbon domain-containing protein [Candidatus Delongbacteria bacterium]